MGLFDFILKRRERKEEKQRAFSKEVGVLAKEVQDWVSKDLEKRLRIVCISAVIGTYVARDRRVHRLERSTEYWRSMMAKQNSSEQIVEEAKV